MQASLVLQWFLPLCVPIYLVGRWWCYFWHAGDWGNLGSEGPDCTRVGCSLHGSCRLLSIWRAEITLLLSTFYFCCPASIPFLSGAHPDSFQKEPLCHSQSSSLGGAYFYKSSQYPSLLGLGSGTEALDWHGPEWMPSCLRHLSLFPRTWTWGDVELDSLLSCCPERELIYDLS